MDDLTASINLNNNNNNNNDDDEENIKNLLLNNLFGKIINISNQKNKNNGPVIILIDNFHEIFINNSKLKHSIDIIQSIIKMQSLVK
jgi:hypothetical protein